MSPSRPSPATMRSSIASICFVPPRQGTHFPQDSFCVKFMKKRANLDHAGLGIHDDEAAGTYHRARRRKRVEVEREVKVFLREAAAGWAAYLDGLEVRAASHTAADLENYLAQRRAHRNFDEASVLYVAGQSEGLRAGALLRAERLVPFDAVVDDERGRWRMSRRCSAQSGCRIARVRPCAAA